MDLLHELLLVRRQQSRAHGALTLALNGVHDVLRLGQERVPEIDRPREVPVQHAEHRREDDERLNARVPGLILGRVRERGALQARIGLQPPIGLDDLERIGGRGENLGDERVGVERDRRDQIVELLGRQEPAPRQPPLVAAGAEAELAERERARASATRSRW